ncbi:DUF6808 domain-containing protein [Millionella massiliensis]|uniref:DUF6808 domain-containing protein n=1 Tax=Millionella massiliensis TaxID=1871023 RepID=UPI0024B6D74D|nr:hypothetical protein [Millionella massiliensis]
MNAQSLIIPGLAIVAGFFLGRGCSTSRTEVIEVTSTDTSTVTLIDTLKIKRPTAVDVQQKRTDTISVAVNNGKVTSIQPWGSGSKVQSEPVKTGTDTVMLPVKCDTDTVKTSVDSDSTLFNVPIPIYQYSFRDSLYFLKVSGFNVEIDEFEVYPRTVYKTITNTTVKTVTDTKRWGIGVQAGYGYNFGSEKPGPYIGIGVQYNIVRW